MLPLIPEHTGGGGNTSDTSTSASTLPSRARARPSSLVNTTRTLPQPPRKKHHHASRHDHHYHYHHQQQQTGTGSAVYAMPRSRSEPTSALCPRTPTPNSTPSPSVSPSAEDSHDGQHQRQRHFSSTLTTPTNEDTITPPRPISLDIKPAYFKMQPLTSEAAAPAKVDREQQTPQDPLPPPLLLSVGAAASGIQFADESSSVIQAGITPPDDGSSGMSNSELKVRSPTQACQESQLSMSPASSGNFLASPRPPTTTASAPPPPVAPKPYLYGRPLNVVNNTETSSSCNSGTIRTTNLPLPIHSEDFTTTEDSDGSLPGPPPPIAALQSSHHVHYKHHHSHHSFQQQEQPPRYEHAPPPRNLPTIYSGTSENNTETESGDSDEDEGSGGCLESSSSDCGECCGGHAPYPVTKSPNPTIIPATMCKATQISPTTVIEMYAASVRRTNGSISGGGIEENNGIIRRSRPHPNGFHIPCPVAPHPPHLRSGAAPAPECPQHGMHSAIAPIPVKSGCMSRHCVNRLPSSGGGKKVPPAVPVRKSVVKVNGDAVNEIVKADQGGGGDQLTKSKRVTIFAQQQGSSIDKSEADSGTFTAGKVSRMTSNGSGGGTGNEDLDEEEDEDYQSGASKDIPVLKKLGKKIRLRRKKKDKIKTENRAKKALRTISFILGAFVTCWTPYHILAIVASFCPTCINIHLYMVSYFLCYLNSPVNPFCYAAANQQFKNAFKRIMTGDLSLKWSRKLTTTTKCKYFCSDSMREKV